MWESAAEVSRRAVVQIPQERAWSLVSGGAAWSLRPGHFAFDVPETTPAGRLRCWLYPFGQGLGCSVQEVREEVPGQVLSLRSRGTQPAGRQAFTLAARPHHRGAEIELTAAVTVPREDKADYQAFWRKELKAWLGALTEVADGRRPWPEPGIPASVQRACAGLPALASPQGTSAGALIRAAPDVVWRAVRAPGIPADPGRPYAAICAGRVPGAPQGQPGEMPYVIVGFEDGQLIASVSIIRDLAGNHLTGRRGVLTQRLEPPYYETRYQVEPVAGGTRLELTMCWPDAPVTDEGEQLRGHLVQALKQTASAYQAAIEAGR